MQRALITLTVALGFALGPAADTTAGPRDSPLPIIKAGKSTRLLYYVPGVIKNNGMETEFVCTSLENSGDTARIAVEVFAADGSGPLNDVTEATADGASDINGGGTITIATGSTAGIHEDVKMLGVANVSNGSARILSTSKRIMCTAFVAEELGAPPISMVALKVMSRKRQNGD